MEGHCQVLLLQFPCYMIMYLFLSGTLLQGSRDLLHAGRAQVLTTARRTQMEVLQIDYLKLNCLLPCVERGCLQQRLALNLGRKSRAEGTNVPTMCTRSSGQKPRE